MCGIPTFLNEPDAFVRREILKKVTMFHAGARIPDGGESS
jgi:hypothetical protein